MILVLAETNQTIFENVYVRFVLEHTVHYRFYVYALYKFTLTLTYHTDPALAIPHFVNDLTYVINQF